MGALPQGARLGALLRGGKSSERSPPSQRSSDERVRLLLAYPSPCSQRARVSSCFPPPVPPIGPSTLQPTTVLAPSGPSQDCLLADAVDVDVSGSLSNERARWRRRKGSHCRVCSGTAARRHRGYRAAAAAGRPGAARRCAAAGNAGGRAGRLRAQQGRFQRASRLSVLQSHGRDVYFIQAGLRNVGRVRRLLPDWVLAVRALHLLRRRRAGHRAREWK